MNEPIETFKKGLFECEITQKALNEFQTLATYKGEFVAERTYRSLTDAKHYAKVFVEGR